MSDDTAPDPVAMGETEEIEPSPVAWAEEPEESRPRLRIDGRIIPAALAAVAVAAVSVAATLMLTAPRQPDRFIIRPVPIEQAPPPKAAPPRSPKAAPPPAAQPAAPPPAAQPKSFAPRLIAPPPDAYQNFTQALRGDTLETQNGAGLYLTESQAVADSEAQEICQDLANGGSIDPYITGTLRKAPSLAPWQAALVVRQAVRAYCPQYSG